MFDLNYAIERAAVLIGDYREQLAEVIEAMENKTEAHLRLIAVTNDLAEMEPSILRDVQGRNETERKHLSALALSEDEAYQELAQAKRAIQEQVAKADLALDIQQLRLSGISRSLILWQTVIQARGGQSPA